MTYETDAAYHDDTERLSNTMLTVLKRSPIEFRDYYVTKTKRFQPTDAMLVGSVTHCLTLEPEQFAERYVVAPKLDRRTREGKLQWDELVSSGKTIVDLADYQAAEMAANAIVLHDQYQALRYHEMIIEQPLHFMMNEQPMRCKPDGVIPSLSVIIDIKTTKDASPTEFSKSVAAFGYARQAALYTDACALHYGMDFRFVFFCVETSYPFNVACYELTDESIRFGGAEALLLIREYQLRVEADNWQPNWSRGIVPLSLPRWYRSEIYELENA